MPIHAPKILVFGIWTAKRDWSSSRPPKRTFVAETALTCQFWWRSVHWCDLCQWWRNQKKARKETYSGKLGVRPDHPRWRSDMWSCMPGVLWELVTSFKFRQNQLNGFRDVGVEICHFLYLRPVAYVTACTTVQAVIQRDNRTVSFIVEVRDSDLADIVRCSEVNWPPRMNWAKKVCICILTTINTETCWLDCIALTRSLVECQIDVSILRCKSIHRNSLELCSYSKTCHS